MVGDAAWPAIIDRATHDRLVGLLKDPSRRLCSTLRGRSMMRDRSERDSDSSEATASITART